MLSLMDLGSLIKRTEAAMRGARPSDAPVLAAQLEDMKEEFHMRSFFGEDVSRWPAQRVPGQVVSRAEPVEM